MFPNPGNMNVFGIRIGGKKEEAACSPREAIQKLRDVENILEKKQEYLERKIVEEINIAKQQGTKNKRAAIQALRRKKKYEAELRSIDGRLINLENQREALEGVDANAAIIESMKFATDALKFAQKKMNVDQVNDIMDEVAEQHELSREISDAISNSFGMGNDVDMDELEKELEDLQQEMLDEELLKTPPAKLPSVPNESPEEISSKKLLSHEDKEMNELLSWAS